MPEIPPTRPLLISIHTLRVEGDDAKVELHREICEISIHTLRVEGDFCQAKFHFLNAGFQSTPSAWRVTQ